MDLSQKRVVLMHQPDVASAPFESAAQNLEAEFSICLPKEVEIAANKADCLILALNAQIMERCLIAAEKLMEANPELALLFGVPQEIISHMRLPGKGRSDFIVMPPNKDELALRLRHLLWPSMASASSDLINMGSMSINLSTYQVKVDGEPIDFTYLEYALLAFLVTHPGHVFSRDVLLSRVWGFDYYGGSRTVDVHVRRVRAKLGNQLADCLETVRGVGYMWNM